MTTFAQQFIGRRFWTVLLGLIALDVVSFVIVQTPVEAAFFWVVAAAMVALLFARPEWLAPLALAEIIATSNGHSFHIEAFGVWIGVRMVVFAALMLATLWRCVRARTLFIPATLTPILFLAAALVVWGTVHGWLEGNIARHVFLDANGYLAIGYVWAACVWIRTHDDRHRLLQAVGAAVAWIALKSLLFVFLFGHLHPKTLSPLYLWIRDTRLGEVTQQVGSVYRIFLQSQWFLVPAALYASAYMMWSERARETGVRVAWMFAIAALLASLSRSFWVGLVAGVVVLAIYAVVQNRWRALWLMTWQGLVLSVTAIALLWILVALPVFYTSSGASWTTLRARATRGTDAAIDSRRQLVAPLLASIAQAPLGGRGLGATVSYTTQDPRYIDMNGTDRVTTYAFEWGWLDLAVKFGMEGAFLFALLLALMAWRAHRLAAIVPARRWWYLGSIATLAALAATHAFSPYLNHPIGWGTVALVAAFLTVHTVEEGVRAPSGLVSAKRASHAANVAATRDVSMDITP